jgi:hypothetical protein
VIAFLIPTLIVGALLSGSSVVLAAPSEPAIELGRRMLPEPGSPERLMYDALNSERLRSGLTPVAWSRELGTAAALHSADMAANGLLDHYGSDGADQQRRAARAGYVVPPGSGWMVIETISARPSVEAALGWLLSDGLHRRVVLRPTWREVGIGYASGGRHGAYWTLDFGCRPNVLPVFADPTGDGGHLSLTFTNENCAVFGAGPDRMGRATEVILSRHHDFQEAIWEPFADTKQVPHPRASELNVRLRDASGRLSTPLQLTLDDSS